MAAAATNKNQQTTVDPKFEWAEKAGSYVIRLALPGCTKDDFRVQVDGAGRLTVRGTRPATGADGQSPFSKVFQLPSAASLDDIAGRFEAGVLTLTVPKRASSAPAPTSIEEIKRKQPGDGEAKEEMAKAKEDAFKKSMDEATNKAQQQKQEEEDASRRKQEQQKQAPAVKKEEELKPKAAAAAPPEKPASSVKKEELKPKVPEAATTGPPQKQTPKPEVATGADKAKAAIDPESLAERVRRRFEEEQRAKAAAAVTPKEAKEELEKKAMAAWGGWKERVQGELKVLTDMKWADGLVEAARKNKEVVAVGVAAFSLGFLVSHKLFRK